MSSSDWKPILIVASLVLLLTYLWTQSRNPDFERRNRLNEALRTLEIRDAELMRDVLLARAGLLPNYDALTRTSQEMIRLSRQLNVELRPDSWADTQSLGAPADKLFNALQEKLLLIENFKSDNALLRNSVMYFDRMGRTLRGPAYPSMTFETARLWQDMFGFVESLEPILTQSIQVDLQRLAKIRPMTDQVQALIAHGHLIVEVLPKLDTLMREIIGTPTAARIGTLQNALLVYGQRVELRAQRFRLLLYLTAVILAGYLFHQFSRLRANTQALLLAHDSLQQEANERRQAEVLLRESEERLRAMTESAHEAIVSVDSKGNIVSWNRGATAMFGYPVGDLLGTQLPDLLSKHRQDQQALLFSDANTLAGPVEMTGIRQDGSEFPLEVSLSNWAKGTERYVTAIIRDISARKRLEETARQQELKLIQTSKMTALGTLVSCVAHEINNPNQLIMMNSGLIDDAWGDALERLDDRFAETGEFTLGGLPYSEMRQALPVLVRDIYDGAKRIERIVADLKDFARPPGGETPVAFSLNDAVQRALRLLAHVIGRKTKHLSIDLAEPLPTLKGNPQQVEQIVVNLLVNALEALPNQEHGVSVATFAAATEHLIALEIRDDGIGIAPEHLESLCDPFFTTKQASGGTGLGLAITASLVQTHGGRLEFFSELGKGTRVRVLFPEG
jgi:PAS domain S-box-containing protein